MQIDIETEHREYLIFFRTVGETCTCSSNSNSIWVLIIGQLLSARFQVCQYFTLKGRLSTSKFPRNHTINDTFEFR